MNSKNFCIWGDLLEHILLFLEIDELNAKKDSIIRCL